MFYDTLKKLCDDAGTTPHAVCLELGLSQGAAPYWKKSGGTPMTVEKPTRSCATTTKNCLMHHRMQHRTTKITQNRSLSGGSIPLTCSIQKPRIYALSA